MPTLFKIANIANIEAPGRFSRFSGAAQLRSKAGRLPVWGRRYRREALVADQSEPDIGQWRPGNAPDLGNADYFSGNSTTFTYRLVSR